ncbi:MAG: MoaD family protein [Candidatus Bathyarchaeia archaeon]
MISVTVRAVFQLKQILGAKETIVQLKENATIDDLIQHLIEKSGRKFEDAIKNPDGSIASTITILLNGRRIDFLEGTKTKLEDGDVVSFIPPVGGG